MLGILSDGESITQMRISKFEARPTQKQRLRNWATGFPEQWATGFPEMRATGFPGRTEG
jgi:hypothetical protein